jgi:RimJ/RimL family protein N-acetyltransferase
MLLALHTDEQLDAFLAMATASAISTARFDWHFAVEDKDTREYLGSCCLLVEPQAPSSAELGYWFLRNAWGKGYASESSSALLGFGFEQLRLHRIWGKCHVRNAASARVMEKLGMRHEGTLREHVWLRDHYRSSHIYSILAEDHRQHHP